MTWPRWVIGPGQPGKRGRQAALGALLVASAASSKQEACREAACGPPGPGVREAALGGRWRARMGRLAPGEHTRGMSGQVQGSSPALGGLWRSSVREAKDKVLLSALGRKDPQLHNRGEQQALCSLEEGDREVPLRHVHAWCLSVEIRPGPAMF